MLHGVTHTPDRSSERVSWKTLVDMLRSIALEAPNRGIYLTDARGNQEFRTYAQICEGALRVGAALQAKGIERHDRVLLALGTNFDFLDAFFGTMAAGAVPIPIAPPLAEANSRTDQAEFFVRFAQRMRATGAIFRRAVGDDVKPPQFGPLRLVSDIPSLLVGVPAGSVPQEANLPDLAWIQTTSGATATRGACRISHSAVLANLEAVGLALGVTDEDFGISWLPLFNTMGLVGGLLFNMYWGLDIALISPERFLRRPDEWLQSISRHRATLAVAPGFAYHYAARRVQSSSLPSINLSSLRVAMVGGEPVHRLHLETFSKRFEGCGLAPNIFMPVYGMAEATLGVAFGPLRTPVRFDIVSRSALETEQFARPASASNGDLLNRAEVCCVGRPLANVDIRVVDDANREVADRVIGEILVRGPNLMTGYDDDPPARQLAHASRLDGAWLRTGDLGYVVGEELFVVGRGDFRLAVGDRKIFTDEIELVASTVDGVRSGTVVVFQNETGVVILAYEVQEGADDTEVATALKRRLSKHFDFEITPLSVSTRSIPKSPGGKTRRHLCVGLYQQGRLDRHDRTADFEQLRKIAIRSRHEALKLTRQIRDRIGGIFSRKSPPKS